MKFAVKLVLCFIFLFVLQACTPAANDNSQLTLLQTADLSVQISPATIPVESPLTLTVKTTPDIQQLSGEVRGISMYMGRIPLHWRKVSDTEGIIWQAEFLLGACTDPQMRWQLTLTMATVSGQQQLQLIDFTSSW